MKKIALILAVCSIYASPVAAGNGDLIVDGNLGVGTTSPQSKLNVFATNNPTLTLTDGTLGVTYGGAVRGYGVVGLGGIAELGVLDNGIYTRGVVVSAQATSLQFFSGGTTSANAERMRINSGGNVLIGTSEDSLDGLLQVGGDSPSPTITIGRTGGYFRTQLVGSTGAGGNDFKLNIGPTNVLYANYNGNVGIGSTEPGIYKLYVNGPAYSTGGWQGSDARFKEDLLPISTAMEKVSNLNGLSYKWKTDEYRDKGFPEGRHYGVIAQEIEKVLPEVVSTAPDGTKAVAYTEIIPVLIEAIKEQQKLIEKQQSRIESLERMH